MYKLKFWGFLTTVAIFYLAAVLIPIILSDRLNPALVVPLITSGVAIVTGILALVKDPVLNAINSPRLKISFYPRDKRDCHATFFADKKTGLSIAKTHYFRLRIENLGQKAAEDVEVTVEEVRKFNGNDYEIDTDFMPLRLFWSHWRNSRYEISIPSGAYRHCDLGFIIDPLASGIEPKPTENAKLLFWLDVFLRPNTGCTSLLPGRYRVVLSAFGRNVSRSSLTAELDWRGDWHDRIEDLLDKSLIIIKGAE